MLGPSAPDVINGSLISVSGVLERSIFAFSAASFTRCNDRGSCERSIPSSFLNVNYVAEIIL